MQFIRFMLNEKEIEEESEEEEKNDQHDENNNMNEEEEENDDFTLVVNGTEYKFKKKLISKASSVIREFISKDKTANTFTIEIEDADSYNNLISTLFTKNPAPIDKYNYSFLSHFSKKLQIPKLSEKVQLFESNLQFLRNSDELKDILFCERLAFSIDDTNINEKVTETSVYFKRPNSSKFNFVRSLYFATVCHIDSLPTYFDFMAHLESVNIPIFKDYSDLPLKSFKRSKTPSLYLENCNEVGYILLKLIEYGIISEEDIRSLKICLPQVFSHLNNRLWVDTVQQNEICKSYFNLNFEELEKNDWELHKKFAIGGIDPNPIVEIIKNDDFDTFQKLSSETNFNINEEIKMTFYLKTSFLKTASLIEIAAFYSAVKIFKFLLMSNAFSTSRLTEFAVAGGNFEIIHICEDKNYDFKDTLPISIRFHHHEIFIWLIENKGCLNFKKTCDLWENCARYGNYRAMKSLIKLGCNPSSLVSELICFRQPDVAKIVLQMNGIDVNLAEKETQGTPLHFACRRKMVEIVKILLSHKEINVNAKAAYDTNPIHSACRSGSFEVVKLLLDRDDIIIDDDKCHTKPPNKLSEMSALQSAAEHGHTQIVKMLVCHHRCDINCRNFVLTCF